MSPNNRWAARTGRIAATLAAAALGASPAAAVVGGQPASGPLADASVMVLSSRGGVCTGVVIAPDAVLTAGHCVSGASEFRVHLSGPNGGAPILIAPVAVVVHPGYDRSTGPGRRASVDLALIRTGEPLPGSVRAAGLGTDVPGRGEPLVVGGFGVEREGDGRSTGTFRTASLVVVEPYGRGKILVWGAPPEGARAGACQGDSGGPVAAESGSVVAITAWAAGRGGQAGCGGLSQAIMLPPQRAWIDRTLAGWGRSATWR